MTHPEKEIKTDTWSPSEVKENWVKTWRAVAVSVKLLESNNDSLLRMKAKGIFRDSSTRWDLDTHLVWNLDTHLFYYV